MFRSILFCLFSVVSLVFGEVYFKDDLTDGDWESRWVQSTQKSDYGKWKLTAGKFYNDEELDKGLQTSQDARFYAIASALETPFSNRGKSLVVQFTVKHEQNIDCGGGYVKIFPSTLDAKDMTGDSEYNIMFGPDICGPGTKKVHVIFQYKGKNLLIKKEIRCKDDVDTHIYTLIVNPDNTYEVLIDNKSAQKGALEEDWDFLPAKEIKDPNEKKPSNWDEREKIPDPDAVKPEEWDQPEHIPDPDATQPEDWDDEMDGEWEAPMIDNPDYKGEWKAPSIDNPDYQGKWIHPMIANPEYEADDELYAYEDFGLIGLDLWQVKSGTIFDNFLMTDSAEEAATEADNILATTCKGEQKMREDKEAEERKKEEAEAAEEEDEDEEEIEDDEDDDDDDDDDDDEEEEEEEDDEETQPRDEL
jgi:calreticulin